MSTRRTEAAPGEDIHLDANVPGNPAYHFTILPAGSLPSHPAELLGSAAMRRVLDALRTRFDRVLIDMRAGGRM